MKDPNVKRRMELARKSYHKGKWRNKSDKAEYDRLAAESMVIMDKQGKCPKCSGTGDIHKNCILR